jgi:hypothetical protein
MVIYDVACLLPLCNASVLFVIQQRQKVATVQILSCPKGILTISSKRMDGKAANY